MDMREIDSSDFPPALREIPQPPKKLWARGSFPAPGTKLLAVVGSRALSSYGREATHKLISGLAGYPISIVSGLALGADAEAHKAALKAGLHTIAVLGSGVDDASVYPRSHLGLARDIEKAGGLILSENAPGYQARPEDFPKRNRIVVGLADAVLIIEAGPKSGTLITARLSGEYNRDLLCIPHRIGDTHGFGANLFLRLGAALVADPSHILEALHIESNSEISRFNLDIEKLSLGERRLYELLEEPLSKDELIRSSGMPAGDALTHLVMLELKGFAKEEFGAWRRI